MSRFLHPCLFKLSSRTFSTGYGSKCEGRISFDEPSIRKCIFPVPVEKYGLFYKIRQVCEDPAKKIFPFIILSFSRGESTEYLNYFGLSNENKAARLLFTILHIWFIHRGFCNYGMESNKVLLWEYLWSYMRDLLCFEEIEEHQFKYNLEEMQHKTLGFCLSLDEAFEEYLTEGNYTLIKRMLIVYFYNNDVQLIDSKNVTNLAIYSILMESFINKIPEKELRHASFTWPEFDPNTNPFV